MRLSAFANRCTKEILRDPINLCFGLGFPVILLLLLSAIQANVPVRLFEIQQLAPGIAVFGLSFMTLFSATLVARDRETALLQRLYTTPLRPWEYILGYMLPMFPMVTGQSIVCYLVSAALGLPISVNTLYAVISMLPIGLMYISLGLLCGSVFSVKQVGGICGALLTNVAAWLSGVWFDLELVGGVFGDIANLLPFVHAVELERSMIHGTIIDALPHLLPVLGYAIFITVCAVALFLRQMKKH